MMTGQWEEGVDKSYFGSIDGAKRRLGKCTVSVE